MQQDPEQLLCDKWKRNGLVRELRDQILSSCISLDLMLVYAHRWLLHSIRTTDMGTRRSHISISFWGLSLPQDHHHQQRRENASKCFLYSFNQNTTLTHMGSLFCKRKLQRLGKVWKYSRLWNVRHFHFNVYFLFFLVALAGNLIAMHFHHQKPPSRQIHTEHWNRRRKEGQAWLVLRGSRDTR